MKEGYGKAHEMAMEDFGLDFEQVAENPLEFLAREGARTILTVALNEEVKSYLGREKYERKPGASPGYRNGTRKRSFVCGSGEFDVDVPRVSDTDETYQSGIIPRWKRRSKLLEQVIPLLYVEGLSTRDFKRALKPLLGTKGLSRSTVSRINKELYDQFKAWRKRDLSNENILLLFLDALYIGTRKGRKEKDAILVAHGVRRDGTRVLLAVAFGGKECTDSWKGILHDLVERRLNKPALINSDGNAGLIRAIKDIYPDVARQRCTKHRTQNVLNRIPKKRQEEVKNMVHRVFYANSLDEALEAAERFSERNRDEFPEACEILGTNLEDCLTYYRFPPRHWRRIRTSNVIERAFKEVRRRTNVVGRFPTSMSAMVMVWSVIEQDRLKWRGIHMDDLHLEMVQKAVVDLQTQPIKVRGFEWLKAA